jgi:hypothetical protein
VNGRLAVAAGRAGLSGFRFHDETTPGHDCQGTLWGRNSPETLDDAAQGTKVFIAPTNCPSRCRNV